MSEAIKSITVVGARGQMGGMFVQACSDAGLDVTTLDKPLADADISGRVAGRDVVLLSVPITAMDEVLEAIVPCLDPKTILTDVCSVKVQPVKKMLNAYSGPVVGTHPLFGPVIPKGFVPKVAVVPGRGDCEDRLSDMLQKIGFQPFATTADEHDKAMAYVQGLNFSTTVAFLASMREIPEVEKFITPSLQRRLDSARKMLTQDRELFETISEANPYTQETVRRFRAMLSVAAGGDLDLLAQRAGWWWRETETDNCKET